MADDFDDAKATLYRDLATIFSILLGFLSVALFSGGVNTNPFSSDFAVYQHPGLSIPTLIMGVLLLLTGRKMVQYDNKVVEAKRLGMQKS